MFFEMGVSKALPGQGRRDGPDVGFWPFNDIEARHGE
jgi:hypothetical protein